MATTTEIIAAVWQRILAQPTTYSEPVGLRVEDGVLVEVRRSTTKHPLGGVIYTMPVSDYLINEAITVIPEED